MDENELELLELQDQVDEVGFLTPREYGKLRGIAPQLVYYYLRQKVLESEVCKCGRRVINVEASDKALASQKDKRRGVISTRSDEERH